VWVPGGIGIVMGGSMLPDFEATCCEMGCYLIQFHDKLVK
jgi:hypothetical protein